MSKMLSEGVQDANQCARGWKRCAQRAAARWRIFEEDRQACQKQRRSGCTLVLRRKLNMSVQLYVPQVTSCCWVRGA